HGGVALKAAIKRYLEENEIPYRDFGTNDTDSVDYAPIAAQVAHGVADGQAEKGRLHANSLFIKIVSAVLLSVICVTALTLSISIRASESVYVDTFTQSSSQIIGQIAENMSGFNDEVVNIMGAIKNSWAFRSYLTSNDRTSASASYTQYSMVSALESALPPDYYEKMSIVVVGVNGSTYLSSDAGLTIPVEELLDSPITQETRRQPNRILYQYTDDGFTTLTQGDSAIVVSTGLNYAGGQSNYGYAYILIPQNVLQGFYSSFSSEANDLLLLDGGGRIVSSTRKQIVGFTDGALLESAKQVEQSQMKYQTIVQNGRSSAVVAQNIPHWNCHLVGVIDRDTILREAGDRESIVVL
ncbi:RpiB/LacA/LacB family sugar-phosphate isomerase, partial [Blautia wexlerae]|nr:RpiB/LacA/LacB family sugar-phosphate isomerase [Blautia wexlerae]